MLKRYFYVKLYPILYLSFWPIIAFFSTAMLVLIFGVYFGFFRAPFFSSRAEEAVPANSSFVLKVKNPSEFNITLKDLPYLDNLNSIDAFRVWQVEQKIIDGLIKQSKASKNKTSTATS